MRGITLNVLSFLIFVLSLSTLLASYVASMRRDENRRSRLSYSYRHSDFPHTWPLPPLPTVYLSHEDNAHYALHTVLGMAEWNATLPRGGAILRLGPDFRPFTLSMFHQLRCLNILRGVFVELYGSSHSDTVGPEDQRMAGHCMNYLRQMVLCRADTRLESVRAAGGAQLTVSDITHTCRDWIAVYKAAEENHRFFEATLWG
ncbi:hypothetical protein C8Q79DRAFT_1007594 [Trametes meyenii]|nr:hypothetical protein C8Q79DRAFT_1007594 [Trametes meyenii]